MKRTTRSRSRSDDQAAGDRHQPREKRLREVADAFVKNGLRGLEECW